MSSSPAPEPAPASQTSSDELQATIGKKSTPGSSKDEVVPTALLRSLEGKSLNARGFVREHRPSPPAPRILPRARPE
jgi:hypothetical protein